MDKTEVKIKYKIYCLESPDHLKVVEPDGYVMSTKYRQVLVDLDDVLYLHGRNEFDSIDEAVQLLNDKKEELDLQGKKFTILPIIEIDYTY